MKKLLLVSINLLFFAVNPLAPSAQADLIQNGYFTSLTYSGSPALTTLYGQFGTGTGSTLTIANWTTTGYNFVYAPNTADAGTKNGANAGQPNEAPGQYNTGAGYGSTYLWGSNNGGASTLPATDPLGGNFIAADGAFQVGAISQTVNGLVAGQVYTLGFYWAAAQQQGYTTATTESWQVSLGGVTAYNTPTYNLPAESFSGWMQTSFNFVANNSSETLSFLASGTPNGQPPFVLLAAVSLNPAPEPSSWMYVVGMGTLCFLVEIGRRRRRPRLVDESKQ